MAWKCAARGAWIGWDFRHQYDRLHLIANNSRLLILPEHHYPNLASRVVAGGERRLAADWRARFGYPLLLLETFVDPRYFHGTLYHAANWRYVGDTRGFRRTRAGYSGAPPGAAKRVFVRPLHVHAQARLSRPILDPPYCHGAPKIMLSADQLVSLSDCFADIPTPAAARGGATRCPRCWPSPRAPSSAGCVATKALACGCRT